MRWWRCGDATDRICGKRLRVMIPKLLRPAVSAGRSAFIRRRPHILDGTVIGRNM
jgi:hypothetical protein